MDVTRSDDSPRERKNVMGLVIALSWQLENFQATVHEEGSLGEIGGLHELSRWSWDPKRPRWLEFKGQSIKDAGDALRENSGDLQDPAEYESGHACEETAQIWGKNDPKGSAGTVARAHTGLRGVSVSTSQTEKNPLIHKALAEYLKKICHNSGK